MGRFQLLSCSGLLVAVAACTPFDTLNGSPADRPDADSGLARSSHPEATHVVSGGGGVGHDGQLGSIDAPPDDAVVLETASWGGAAPPAGDVIAQATTRLLIVIDLEEDAVEGSYEVDYLLADAASTCDETVEYSAPTDFAIDSMFGDLLMDVRFHGERAILHGRSEGGGTVFAGESPFVEVKPGVEASENWSLGLVATTPFSFHGRSEVAFRATGSSEPFCTYAYEVFGQQR